MSPTVTTTRTALYRFFAADGALLYVGITDQLGQRWHNHCKKKAWWPEVQRHTAEWLDSRAEAETAEKAAIRTERPKYNVVHRPKPPKPPRPRREKPVRAHAKPDPEADYWTLQDVADHYGIKYASARRYRVRGELPPEDKLFGRSPVWKPATILGHKRPGQGARTDLKETE